MANALSIYGGSVHANAQDGTLITNERRISLSGLRNGSVIGMYAFRASADKPACVIKGTIVGTEASQYKLSADGANWSDKLEVLYVGDYNVLFYIKCNIPEEASYGTHSNTYLVIEYKGGV